MEVKARAAWQKGMSRKSDEKGNRFLVYGSLLLLEFCCKCKWLGDSLPSRTLGPRTIFSVKFKQIHMTV